MVFSRIVGPKFVSWKDVHNNSHDGDKSYSHGVHDDSFIRHCTVSLAAVNTDKQAHIYNTEAKQTISQAFYIYGKCNGSDLLNSEILTKVNKEVKNSYSLWWTFKT